MASDSPVIFRTGFRYAYHTAILEYFNIKVYRLKSVILAIFQKGLGWPCPVSAALKNASYQLQNSFCFGCQ